VYIASLSAKLEQTLMNSLLELELYNCTASCCGLLVSVLPPVSNSSPLLCHLLRLILHTITIGLNH
jgi:hypothetical protein